MVTKSLHREHSNPLLDCDWHDLPGERPEVRIHDIDWHLYRVEMEAVRLSSREHPEMHRWILVAGKPDVANLARLTCGNRSLKRSAGSKDAVRIFQPNDFVELHQIDDLRLQSPQSLLQLKLVSPFVSAIHLPHHESLA